jgi:class 3 adenylate cyclase
MSVSQSSGGGLAVSLPPDCKLETLGIAFFDLSRFAEWASSDEDERIAAFLQQFYVLAARSLEPAGCRLVKFMGDAGMAVFPIEKAEAAIFALCDFSNQARRAALAVKLDAHCNTNIHVGEVITGSFGPQGLERFDVIGKAVNVAARLGRRGVVLSPQAFRTLSDEARKRFQKITRPITYSFRG